MTGFYVATHHRNRLTSFTIIRIENHTTPFLYLGKEFVFRCINAVVALHGLYKLIVYR